VNITTVRRPFGASFIHVSTLYILIHEDIYIPQHESCTEIYSNWFKLTKKKKNLNFRAIAPGTQLKKRLVGLHSRRAYDRVKKTCPCRGSNPSHLVRKQLVS
jgi:hypothetical protein